MVSNKQVYSLYHKLVYKAKVAPSYFYIHDVPSINASSGWGNESNICINEGCLRHLHKLDIEAIIAHELGHIKDQEHNDLVMLIVLALQIVVFISAMIYTVSIVRASDTSDQMIFNVMFLPAFVLCSFLSDIIVSRLSENKADTFGANLVGKQVYINMLKHLKSIRDKQDKDINQDIKDLILCPIACLHEIFILTIFKITEILEYSHLSFHLTYSQRIARI